MNTKIKTLLCKRISEYRCIYPGQLRYQPAYIVIEPEGDEPKMYAYYNGEIGGGVPMTVYHGREIWVGITPFFKMRTVNEILRLVEPLAQRVVNGYSVDWDGSNNRGHLDDDAELALRQIEATVTAFENRREMGENL